MPDDLIWHYFDSSDLTLRIAFVNEDGLSVFVYRLCPRCGVTMGEAADGTGHVCSICGTEWVP